VAGVVAYWLNEKDAINMQQLGSSISAAEPSPGERDQSLEKWISGKEKQRCNS
jgi:hypothetical protein